MTTMQLFENHSLKDYHTFHIDVKARYFTEISTEKSLKEALDLPMVPKLILGGGSNILFTKFYPGLVILNRIRGIAVIDEMGDQVIIEVGSGENWHQFVLWCLARNYGGVENLSLIPGTVGAAPIQNIGAYGIELTSVFENLTAINRTSLTSKIFTKSACAFDYRNSVFKSLLRGQYVITKVRFRLSKRNHRLHITYGAIQQTLKDQSIHDPTIRDVSNAVIAIRQSKLPDPVQLGNAGSFFKNPVISQSVWQSLLERFPESPSYPTLEDKVKIPAAWLIEKCGWKGYRSGDAGVYQHHSLVLVNHQNAKGGELIRLVEAIQQSVYDNFAIQLEPEVNIL